MPTGGQCWTLFLNAGNFKGPVVFFAPTFFSRPTVDRPELAGMFLDARPSEANRALQMETQFIPAVFATAEDGARYARVARTLFPDNLPAGRAAAKNGDGDGDGDGAASVTVHGVRSYRRAALWDAVAAWFAGGPAADGRIDPGGLRGAHVPRPRRGDVADRPPWRQAGGPGEGGTGPPSPPPTAFADDTFGYRWNPAVTRRVTVGGAPCVLLPEHYRLGEEARGRPLWVPLAPADVPRRAGVRRSRPHHHRPGLP